MDYDEDRRDFDNRIHDLAEGAAAERAKIVAWLRNEMKFIHLSSYYADKIERGEHEREGKRDDR